MAHMHRVIAIHVVEKDQLGIVFHAGLDGVFHDDGPLFLPKFCPIGNPSYQIDGV
ncbi:hypothetical protein P872_19465 [Rhodonellum psychrophilum GCM71 = DSM 17998]|uniref:Uncharacterized protein n=1 Tax=Rhodonellum psychrophilum GCM71 = DSM 17998 TaxID=1123057 RepID=U5C0G7_9BACT|nr:hypothetical protein P872_19465 [Rhodonellum psychrophilum GCM71 = DSM 17998]